MRFYKKMYIELYDEQSWDVIGDAYERINSFKAIVKTK